MGFSWTQDMVGRVSKVPYDDWRPFIMGMCPLALQNHICQVKKKKNMQSYHLMCLSVSKVLVYEILWEMLVSLVLFAIKP